MSDAPPPSDEPLETHSDWVAGAIGAGLALFLNASLVLPTLSSHTTMVVSVLISLAGGYGAGVLLLNLAPRRTDA